MLQQKSLDALWQHLDKRIKSLEKMRSPVLNSDVQVMNPIKSPSEARRPQVQETNKSDGENVPHSQSQATVRFRQTTSQHLWMCRACDIATRS